MYELWMAASTSETWEGIDPVGATDETSGAGGRVHQRGFGLAVDLDRLHRHLLREDERSAVERLE